MGYQYNLFWLAQFCVTLGVLWMLAPFIDTEDRSPLCFVRLIKVSLYASQSLQLAFGRGWNALLCLSHCFVFARDIIILCFEGLALAPADCFESFAVTSFRQLGSRPHLSCFPPLVFNGSAPAVECFFGLVFPSLHFALFVAPFSWSAPVSCFLGSIQDFCLVRM